MSKTLTYEQMMALFAEGRKETAELRTSIFVIAVETKTDLQISDVNKHAKRLRILRELPRFKGKRIYGALATAVSDS